MWDRPRWDKCDYDWLINETFLDSSGPFMRIHRGL